MKNMRRIIFAIVAFAMLIMSMTAISSFAAESGTVVYLKPNSNWKTDNARFAMYVWKDGSSYKWVGMTDDDGDEIYEGTVPAGYKNIIFCRMNPTESHNGWSTTWNQTKDLTLPTDGSNLYEVASGAWEKGEGSWSKMDCSTYSHSYGENNICVRCGIERLYIIAGNVMKDGDTYKEGDNSTLFVSKWDETDENNMMEYDDESGCYVKVYKNVAAGEYHFKVAEGKSWDVSYGDNGGNCYIKVDEDGSTVTIAFKDGKVTSAVSVPKVPVKPDAEETPDNSDDIGNSNTEQNNGNSDGVQDGGSAAQPKLNFFQRIWQAILNFFGNLFGKKR